MWKCHVENELFELVLSAADLMEVIKYSETLGKMQHRVFLSQTFV